MASEVVETGDFSLGGWCSFGQTNEVYRLCPAPGRVFGDKAGDEDHTTCGHISTRLAKNAPKTMNSYIFHN